MPETINNVKNDIFRFLSYKLIDSLPVDDFHYLVNSHAVGKNLSLKTSVKSFFRNYFFGSAA